ncbi:class I SAM-dependent methyltransferase [Fictibacillus barbaricus]|uniref:Ubiquinone/menaquinone biosynthesis C-methylase UbiE n=1 Tax=Fictibacillus barbaricus TaxID=182136 RepID=A0ABU1TVZ6_9BACL|nr:class I SAM-dependent methyltransferase [Fictibacillus barbaricus]MDR7071383.1 ubiquinone/menaquinone biosynthesis C-methylase UbiE [Fictibacillus barbaricus]
MENVIKQYKNASNLDIRIRIHEQYSTNKTDWHEWLFDQYEIQPNSKILELGCGSGAFWVKNKSRIPADWQITLSDFSSGMLQDAQNNLEGLPNLSFQQINIQEIPFDVDSFDVVIANHMLYHVPDRSQALSEIRRVLKPGGLFYSSTIGEEHLKEFGELLTHFDSKLDYSSAYLHAQAFGMENGEQQLKSVFSSVKLIPFPGDLHITETDAIVEYLSSTDTEVNEALLGHKLEAFKMYLEKLKDKNGGYIPITKATGLFVSN